MSINLKLTPQEQKVIRYCTGKDEVNYEELAQFSKDPKSVKLSTIRKIISDLKKKFVDANLPIPFDCKFSTLVKEMKIESKAEESKQVLVKVVKTPSGNVVPDDGTSLFAHVDFKLDKNYRKVKTRNGSIELGPQEWEIFSYLHSHAEKPVSLEELKEVVYPKWGSKTPHNWADSISRSLTKIRKNIPELKMNGRLLTITSMQGTSYMLK